MSESSPDRPTTSASSSQSTDLSTPDLPHGQGEQPRNGHLIVGIGASAGGLDAFRTFFAAMPADSGMAFVVVQHLDPDYDSALAEILNEHTAMPVARAEDGTVAASDTVSVIPPNTILKIEDGVLRVAAAETPTARRSSIDTFLASLAHDQGDNAVGIILSGFGTDGTIGIAAIKEAGGLTLSEAEFDHHAKHGMPESAAASGFVDNVLRIEEMPARLLEHRDFRAGLAAENPPDDPGEDDAGNLVTICAILHSRLGRDFGQYKTSTLLRRVRRRMQALRIENVAAYIEQLRALPNEPDLLFREILIGVTRFFRDPEMFDELAERVIPDLIAQGVADTPVRIWVAGCATGEEAYSLAMLFREASRRVESARRVIIFATDVDDRAVTFARAGVYSDAIEVDVSAERLEQHFIKEGGRYRIAKHIREMCVFSTHDLVKDPPFSKLDLTSCRNLLIYFEAGLQQRIITTFHYGLKPGGILWLGPSETVAASARLFKALNKRSRIFRRLDVTPVLARPLPSRGGKRPPTGEEGGPQDQAARIMSAYAPAYVVLDDHHEIQRFAGPVAKFLEPVSGGASFDLFRLLHSELRAPARTLLRKAAEGQHRAQEQLTFRVGSEPATVNLIVEPMTDPTGRQSMILAFQELAAPLQPAAGDPSARSSSSDPSHEELLAAREQLRTITEDLATANEELQSSNEEFQSVNEELHSTVEELETSKEELQSINEELHTVNAELENRAESLARSNSDLANLFDSTSVATIFLDGALRIRRFTPAVTDIFNIRVGDEGRPITDFASSLSIDTLARNVEIVLRDLTSIEREIESDDGASTYLVRIRPYRDLDNVINGVSMTFVDISERKRLERDRAHLAAIVESSEDAIIGHDLDGMITSWNNGASKIYGYAAGEIIGEPMSVLLGDHQADEWPRHLARLRRGETIKNFDVTRTAKDGRTIHLSLTISPIRDGAGSIVGASAVARDVAERKAAEERAALLMGELDHRVKNILAVVRTVIMHTLRERAFDEEITGVIEGRISAIARAHSLLTQHGGVEGSLRDLIAAELAAFESQVHMASAAEVTLLPRAALPLALAVHELATNAAKYGALSSAGGTVHVGWDVATDGSEPVLMLTWQEQGGPPVSAPTRRGFGTTLIERSLVHGLDATVQRDFDEAGVTCRIRLPLSNDVGRRLASPSQIAPRK